MYVSEHLVPGEERVRSIILKRLCGGVGKGTLRLKTFMFSAKKQKLELTED